MEFYEKKHGRTLLWVGDACVSSGFAKVTHEVLNVLKDSWDVHVLGLNYKGDPHPYPYNIYPCWPGGDGFGLGRMKGVATAVRPDVIVILNDPWNVKPYLDLVTNIRTVASMPLDGDNCKTAKELNTLAHAIFWTEHALREARVGGFEGEASIVPLGVDTKLFVPSVFSKESTRRECGFMDPETFDKFIVGTVNRNQPRKHLDLLIRYFAHWVKNFDVRDAMLHLHIAPTGDTGIDARQLAKYYGLQKRLIIAEPPIGPGYPDQMLVRTLQCFDVQATTTQGEGWGLPHLEGMACGIPQILPRWSALGEWAAGAAYFVDCTFTTVTPQPRINVVGGLPDEGQFIAALKALYGAKDLRAQYADAARARALEERFRWPAIGEQYCTILEEVCRK